MSFLAPLYALGALAVALPIVFHLIQKRPRGEFWFSSTMFLSPSPPQTTRRRNLNDVLLLVLRASALVLLAIAFARPFLRNASQGNLSSGGRQIAVLIDRSASMQRDSLWEQATSEVRELLKTMGENDQVAFYSFDHKLSQEVGFSGDATGSLSNIKFTLEALEALRPSSGGTDLGQALMGVLDQFESYRTLDPLGERLIVVITDFQQGTRVESLRSRTWPPDVRLELKQVHTSGTNASLRTLAAAAHDEPSGMRVRVSNQGPLECDKLEVLWQADGEPPLGTPVKTLQLPARRSRVVTIPSPPTAGRLLLRGDDHPFDNEVFLTAPQFIEKTILYIGDATDMPDRQFFFLQRTQLGSRHRPVRIILGSATTPPDRIDPMTTPLVIATRAVSDDWSSVLRAYLQQSGRVLAVLDPSEYETSDGQMDVRWLATLLELEDIRAEVVASDTYASLSDIDYGRELFQPFADVKFNDFAKIRFWKHCRLTANHEQPWITLARFNDQSTAIAEKDVGSGRVWVLAAGWNPDTSQMALSTKFVPLLATMLGPAIEAAHDQRGFTVGQSVGVSQIGAFSQVRDPQGNVAELSDDAREFGDTNHVGIYRFVGSNSTWDAAVNLDPNESQTEPMDVAELEQYGVLLDEYETSTEVEHRQRQLRDVEMESHQKGWRWLLAAALAFLAIETYLGGRISHDQATVGTELLGPQRDERP